MWMSIMKYILWIWYGISFEIGPQLAYFIIHFSLFSLFSSVFLLFQISCSRCSLIFGCRGSQLFAISWLCHINHNALTSSACSRKLAFYACNFGVFLPTRPLHLTITSCLLENGLHTSWHCFNITNFIQNPCHSHLLT